MLFCAANKIDLVHLFWFPLFSHIYVTSRAIFPNYYLKHPYCCFSYHLCFLDFVVLLLTLLLQATVLHHHVVLLTRISLTLFRSLSLSSIATPGYILHQHSAVVDKFLLVFLLLLVHVKGSTGVYRL